MNQKIQKVAAVALRSAMQGVDYTARWGAVCPWCGKERIPVYCTRPWSGKVRVRYHRCNNKDCLLCQMRQGIKSLQTAKQE